MVPICQVQFFEQPQPPCGVVGSSSGPLPEVPAPTVRRREKATWISSCNSPPAGSRYGRTERHQAAPANALLLESGTVYLPRPPPSRLGSCTGLFYYRCSRIPGRRSPGVQSPARIEFARPSPSSENGRPRSRTCPGRRSNGPWPGLRPSGRKLLRQVLGLDPWVDICSCRASATSTSRHPGRTSGRASRGSRGPRLGGPAHQVLLGRR